MEYTHTTQPIVVGASTVAVKYADGVLMCTDTLASYGSLARYKQIPRMAAIGSNTLIGASGEYSDFQEIVRTLRAKEVEDFIEHDKVKMDASHYASLLASMMYTKRNKMNPLYNAVLIAGFVGGASYLATVDLYGTYVCGDFLETGFASHMGKPILESEWRPGMSEAEAKELIEKVMRVLWYRDARASDRS